MASAGADLPPWDRRNVQEGGLFARSEYKDVLSKSRVTLRDNLRLHDVWPHLHQMGVITQNDEERMRLNAPNCDSVDRMIRFINTCETWCYHALLRAMVLTQQGHLIPQGGLPPEVYMESHNTPAEKDVQSTPKEAKQPSPVSAATEIREHHDVYHRTLMQGALLDIPSLDLPYNTALTYIQVVATLDERLTKPEDVRLQDILKPKPGKPRLRTALLSGPTGAGKSSFIRFYVYKSTQRKDGNFDWDLIVILNVSTLKLTEGLSPEEHIKEAIQQSLEGRGDKDAIMKSLDDDNLNILIIPDGLDECRNSTILEMLKELVSSCHKGKLRFTVLCTCRSGLSPIKDSLYDRRMKLDGFTIQEGVEYVKRFYQEIQKPDDDSIFDFIANNTEELDHILTNPLCVHILSVVTSDGTLALAKGQRLKLTELFQAMEKSMRKRQVEKMLKGGSENISNKNQLEDEIKHFYNMTLWTLLKDERTFDDKVLSLFGINDQHPYLTFTKKTRKVNSDLESVSYWNFSHETFHEFFAASALLALPDDLLSTLLLTISSNERFRNTQKILFSVLGQHTDKIDKLSDMIRVNLITQRQSGDLDAATRKAVDDIESKAKRNIDFDNLLTTLTTGKKDDTSSTQAVWQSIKQLYEDETEQLQRRGFFYQTLHSSSYLIKPIYDCLHEVPEEHQQLVFEQSLGCTMPSMGVDPYGGKHMLYSTGGMRWSVVTERVRVVEVDIIHSLTDAAEAVRQYGQQHLATWKECNSARQLDRIWLSTSHQIHGLDIGRMWGDPPRDQFLSTALWADLLLHISDWSVTANTLYKEFDPALDYGALGFLQCLQLEHTQDALRRLLVQDEEGQRRIEMFEGQIDSESLLAWTEWYLQQDLLQVRLLQLTCQISGEDSATIKQQQRRVRSIQHTEHNGCRLFVSLNIEGPSEGGSEGSTEDTTRSPTEEMEAEFQHQHQRQNCCPCQ